LKSSSAEPHYVYSVSDVAAKSPRLSAFIKERDFLNSHVDAAGNSLVKRFYNIDHNTYLNGALPAVQKELQGLAVSAALRCDDCINYHIMQSYRLGCMRPEIEETLNVALVVGGSIVIPHLRRAYAVLAELYEA
jgi:AhpD family alkylhydroperoxidase